MRTLLAFLGVLVLATGCLTIEENYTFKKDGSGSMEYVMDLSGMADMMDGLPGAADKKEDGFGGLGMEAKVTELKKVSGVKKVKLKQEQKGFVQRLSFRFKDITALNAALNILMPDSSGAPQQFFRWEGNTLVRTNNHHAEELSGGVGATPDDDSLAMTGLLESMKYKYSFNFANPVANVEAVPGMIKDAPDSRHLKLGTDWSVIMKDPNALDLRITLDR